jgi:cysteine-rich repeat protein
MDGKMDEYEECDDGNTHNSDGCSIDCLLEDEMKWLCVTTMGEKTTCCPLLVHPMTLQKICRCYDDGAETECGCSLTVQPDALLGFTITKDCEKRDIDECNANNGNCHIGAICTNVDAATDGQNITHRCECRPGLIGDGVLEYVAPNPLDTGVVPVDAEFEDTNIAPVDPDVPNIAPVDPGEIVNIAGVNVNL